MLFTLHGVFPSKKNSKRIVRFGNRPGLISSANYEAWREVAGYELKAQVKGMANRIAQSGPHKVTITFFAADRRGHDLGNSHEGIMDLLVEHHVIADDNWFEVERIDLIFGGVDKANPRAEIEIKHITQ